MGINSCRVRKIKLKSFVGKVVVAFFSHLIFSMSNQLLMKQKTRVNLSENTKTNVATQISITEVNFHVTRLIS